MTTRDFFLSFLFKKSIYSLTIKFSLGHETVRENSNVMMGSKTGITSKKDSY